MTCGAAPDLGGAAGPVALHGAAGGAGGRAARLRELLAAGFAIPCGFVLPAAAHRDAMEAAADRFATAPNLRGADEVVRAVVAGGRRSSTHGPCSAGPRAGRPRSR